MRSPLPAGVALAAIALFPLAACGSGGTTSAAAGPAASPSVSAANPASTLAAAVAKTRATNLALTLGDKDDQAKGQYDAGRRVAALSVTDNGETMQFSTTSDDLYLLGVKELNGSNVRMKLAKLKPTSSMVLFADPLAGLDLLAAAKDVTSNTPGMYAGVVDVSAMATPDAGTKAFATALATVGGAAAHTIHFVAKVDGQGFVTEFNAPLPKMDSGKDVEYQEAFSAFGQPVTVTVPTTKVIEAPADAYDN